MTKILTLMTIFLSVSAHAGVCKFKLETVRSSQPASQEYQLAAQQLSDCNEAARKVVDAYYEKNGDAVEVWARVNYSVDFVTHATKSPSNPDRLPF